MKVFTCKDFSGHWPVPVSAIVVAETLEDAREKLLRQLEFAGLKQDSPITLVEVDQTRSNVILLSDGEY